jgi:hypothetical protein
MDSMVKLGELGTWERVRARELDDRTRDRFEGYVGEILGAFGLDRSTPGTVDTPRRFLHCTRRPPATKETPSCSRHSRPNATAEATAGSAR